MEPANRTPSERKKVTNVYQQQREMFSKSKKTRITKDGVSERGREREQRTAAASMTARPMPGLIYSYVILPEDG